jgi:hypothetical protein
LTKIFTRIRGCGLSYSVGENWKKERKKEKKKKNISDERKEKKGGVKYKVDWNAESRQVRSSKTVCQIEDRLSEGFDQNKGNNSRR